MSRIGWLFLVAVATHVSAQASPPTFAISPASARAGEVVTLTLYSPAADPPPVGRLYVTQWDPEAQRSGATRVLDTTVFVPGAVPPGSTGLYHASFSMRLPVGLYVVGYYDTLDPDSTQPAAAGGTIVVREGGPLLAIEFYEVRSDHYFVTADADEIRRLDDGTLPGWQRTGEAFGVIDAAQTIGVLPVCRLYGLPHEGVDTHFYSVGPTECASVVARWPDRWQLESERAFSFQFSYFCDDPDYAREVPVYRLYNARPDPNHRYTTSEATRDAMVARSWTLEGGQFACAVAR